MTGVAWNEMLDELRALGGTAENLCLRAGPFGRGLFAEDPTKSVELRVPPNILVDVDDVVFEDGVFRVGPASKLNARERTFVEKYQAEFSWGAGGRTETESFFELAKALPEHARNLLGQSFGLGFLLAKTTPERIQERFIAARRIKYKERTVVMPVMDLINYGHGASFDTNDGILLTGIFSDEVLVSYTDTDPLGIFMTWGFASEAQLALSIPIQLNASSGTLRISRDYNSAGPPPHQWTPKLTAEGDQLRLPFLVLGLRRFPRLAKGIFCRVMKETGQPNVEEMFEYIRHTNQVALIESLSVLDEVEGPMARTIRKMILWQLRTIADCFGSRDPFEGGTSLSRPVDFVPNK